MPASTLLTPAASDPTDEENHNPPALGINFAGGFGLPGPSFTTEKMKDRNKPNGIQRYRLKDIDMVY